MFSISVAAAAAVPQQVTSLRRSYIKRHAAAAIVDALVVFVFPVLLLLFRSILASSLLSVVRVSNIAPRLLFVAAVGALIFQFSSFPSDNVDHLH